MSNSVPLILMDPDVETTKVLSYFKKVGQLLDTEIVTGMGIPLTNVHRCIVELATQREISRCQVTRHEQGQTVESIQCRISGYALPPTPGRKVSLLSCTGITTVRATASERHP